MIGVALLLSIFVLVVVAALWARSGKRLHEAEGSGIIESIPDALEQYPVPSHTLTIMSFNIAYALGGQQGVAQPSDPAAVYDRLDQMVETIAASGADVALLQAVDFASSRSHDIDQLHYIAAVLGWGFAARATTWQCRYVPYPLWPLGLPLGRVRAGMGVISRLPLVQNTRQQLLPAGANAFAAPYLPSSMVQMVDVQCGTQVIRLLNVHLHGCDAVTQRQQAQALVKFVQPVSTPSTVLMGSFNADLKSSDTAMRVIIDGLRDDYRIARDTGLIDPATTPQARFDHVFTASGLEVLDTRVERQAAPVSDHRPLVTHLRWQLPMFVQDGGSIDERL
jgi:endonuclease/exonuclease/phosphatase family metal-dependent hydrolase